MIPPQNTVQEMYYSGAPSSGNDYLTNLFLPGNWVLSLPFPYMPPHIPSPLSILADCAPKLYLKSVLPLVAGVGDTENWLGKPMAKERADAIIKLIESQIQTTRNLEPKPPIEDSPPIDITNIEMTSPPSYKMGEKVGKLLCFLLSS